MKPLNQNKMTAVKWLIEELRGDDVKGDFIFNGVITSELINQAKEMENVLELRNKKLETLARLLGKTWFYGEWKYETPNERVMQMLMQELGLYPFKDEDEMIQQTKVNDDLYK
jgi:hypothetical protein